MLRSKHNMNYQFLIVARWVKENFLALLVFLFLSTLFIAKALYVPNCLAYRGDIAGTQTIAALAVAFQALKAGWLPQINFFDNFGTPLLGDGMTLPFALHSLTYLIFSGVTAMMVNRFLMTFLALCILYIFFRGYFTKYISILLSSFVVWLWAPFNIIMHHRFQAGLFFLVLLLVLIRWFGEKKIHAGLFLCLSFITSVLLILSVNYDILIVIFPIAATASIFLENKEQRYMALLAFLVSVFAALLATAPQTIAFIEHISSSERIEVFKAGVFSPNRSILHTIFSFVTNVTVGGYLNSYLYLSLVGVVGSVLGCYYLIIEKSKRQIGLLVLSLGFLPNAIIFLLFAFPHFWELIPVLNSFDITHFVWYSGIFIAIGFGYFLVKLLNFELSSRAALGGAILSLALSTWQFSCRSGLFASLSCSQFDPYNGYGDFLDISMVLFSFSLFTYFLLVKNYIKNNLSPNAVRGAFLTLFSLSLIMAVVANPLGGLGLRSPATCDTLDGFFTSADRVGFQPPSLLKKTEPLHRIASLEHPSWVGSDQAASYQGRLLGSNGMNPINNHLFARALYGKGLIKKDDAHGSYHFINVPEKRDEFEKLGIRYILTRASSDYDPVEYGWVLLGNDGGATLYESPIKPTPFYLVDAKETVTEFIRDYGFYGNTAEILLPELKEKRVLVATFAYRPGWEATIDDSPAEIYTLADRLIRIDVGQEARIVRVTYAPFTWKDIVLWTILGVAIVLFIILATRYGRI